MDMLTFYSRAGQLYGTHGAQRQILIVGIIAIPSTMWLLLEISSFLWLCSWSILAIFSRLYVVELLGSQISTSVEISESKEARGVSQGGARIFPSRISSSLRWRSVLKNLK